jgi:hypothetical protein
MKYFIILLTLILSTSYSIAGIETTTIYESAELSFKEPFLITIKSDTPLYLGLISKDQDCKDICFGIGRKRGKIINHNSKSGNEMKFLFWPHQGEINASFHYNIPGKKTVKIFQEKLICDSEACDLLKEHDIEYPYHYKKVKASNKRVIIKKISSTVSSSDKSYTRINGETVFGDKFNITLINWLIDGENFNGSCAQDIVKNKNSFIKTGKGYSFSGSFLVAAPLKKVTPLMTYVKCGNFEYKDKKKDFF